MAKRLKLSNNLIQSIVERKWLKVNWHLSETDKHDSTNAFALHVACCDPTVPLKIISVIYFTYPAASLTKNIYQHTPIIIAVDAGFEDAVHFLVNECSKASEICDAQGDMPIQLAMYSASSNNMIDSIVISNPKTAFILDRGRETAIEIFFHQWNIPMRIAVINDTKSNKVFQGSTAYGDWDILDIYKKVCLF